MAANKLCEYGWIICERDKPAAERRKSCGPAAVSLPGEGETVETTNGSPSPGELPYQLCGLPSRCIVNRVGEPLLICLPWFLLLLRNVR